MVDWIKFMGHSLTDNVNDDDDDDDDNVVSVDVTRNEN